jgi:D-glycero-alpha-D-manno-heptose-7-phosphate kinase
MDAGALGAKISGAGGGGFLMVYCERNYQDKLRYAMRDYRELPFLLDKFGSRIIFNQSRYDIK